MIAMKSYYRINTRKCLQFFNFTITINMNLDTKEKQRKVLKSKDHKEKTELITVDFTFISILWILRKG